MTFLLQNPIRPYAWGSRDRIAALLGIEPSGEPMAELWIGAHPQDPSETEDGPLDALIAADPPALLGPGATRLPFLMKLLSAAEPLSIQVHPDREQARAGHDREEAAGVPQGPERSYPDANHKPEILYALGPFAALSGLRPLDEARAVVSWFQGRRGTEFGARIAAELAVASDHAGVLRLILESGPQGGATADAWAALSEAAPAELAGPRDAGPTDTLRRVTAAHPGDPGALVALLLHRVDLRAGEVLRTDAGILHAYLAGDGIEVMAESDNVLRGGLTGKRIDLPELLAVSRLDTGAPDLIPASTADVVTIAGTAPEVGLTVLRAGATAPRPDGPALALALEGEMVVEGPGGPTMLRPGQSAFLPAGESGSVSARGLGFLAHAQG